MTNISEQTNVLGVPAGRIAGVIHAEGGVFAGKNYPALLAIAQAMLDMTESGRFGTGLDRVLRYHFASPEEGYHPDCLKAVEDVFFGGIRRSEDWMILQFRSFSGYAKANGEPDEAKLSSVLAKYSYLGKDSISPRWGHFYFGKKRIYRVQVGAYRLRSNATRMKEKFWEEGKTAVIVTDKDLFLVQLGGYYQLEKAETLQQQLIERGYKDAFIVSGF